MVDALILGLLAGLGFAGYQRGAVVSAIVLGAVITVGVLAGALVASVGGSGAAVLVGLATMAVVATCFAVQLRSLEEAVHARIGSAWRQFDRPAGAAGNVLLGLVLVWCVTAVVSLVPQPKGMAKQIHEARVGQALLNVVSPTGDVAVLILRSGLVPALGGPVVIVDEPEPLQTAAITAAANSVVKVSGVACDHTTNGTGWVAARGFVITNAHVVAGHQRTFVSADGASGSGARVAQVMAFDPLNDIAVLWVPRLDLPPLARIAEAPHGTPAVTIGFPQRFRKMSYPARFDRIVRFEVADIYETHRQQTVIAVFRGEIHPGNSGSPLVDASGRVLATVTAAAVGQALDGGYAVPNSIVEQALLSARRPVSTGACLEQGGPRRLAARAGVDAAARPFTGTRVG